MSKQHAADAASPALRSSGYIREGLVAYPHVLLLFAATLLIAPSSYALLFSRSSTWIFILLTLSLHEQQPYRQNESFLALTSPPSSYQLHRDPHPSRSSQPSRIDSPQAFAKAIRLSRHCDVKF